MDNGPEFVAKIAQSWSEMQGIAFKYIQPGKPTQTTYIERFNRIYRQSVLDSYLFDNFDEVREISQEWLRDYNHNRPHDALGKCANMDSNSPMHNHTLLLTTFPHPILTTITKLKN